MNDQFIIFFITFFPLNLNRAKQQTLFSSLKTVNKILGPNCHLKRSHTNLYWAIAKWLAAS